MNKKVKIAILVDQLIPGGVQKTAISEVKSLNKLGFDAHLLVLMRKSFDKKVVYPVKGVPYEFLTDRYGKILQSSFKFPVFRFLSSGHLISPILAPLYIKKAEFDIIISHGTTTSLTSWSLSKFAQIPYIAVVHDPMNYILDKVYSKTSLRFFFPALKPLAAFFEKKIVTSAKTCIVDSNVHAKFIENNYKVKPQILYLSVSPPKTIPKKRGDKIISFGRWDAGKNLVLLLDLMRKLPNAKLIIAGSWSSADELKDFKRQIRSRKLAANIRLITSYNQKGLEYICRQGRFFLHPHFEAFSLSALEAAGFGLPIIIPQKSGITELFTNGKHGFFPQKMSPRLLADLAQKLLSNERLAWQMGREAASIVRNLHDPSVRAKRLANIITDSLIINRKKIYALETGQVGSRGVAGGDQLLSSMLKNLKSPFAVTVIIPATRKKQWLNSGTGALLQELPNRAFDKSTNQLLVFANYMARSFENLKILLKNRPEAIYSATEILPDVLPAYFTKIIKPHTYWLARVHHLWPDARQRPGNYLVNFASGFIQSALLKAIKSKADIILALNENLKDQLEDLGFEKKKIAVLGGGVDYQRINAYKPKKTMQCDAIFLGRIHPAKGVFDLPVIWKAVTGKLPQAKLAIIGPGPENMIKHLKSQINKHNLNGQIKIMGFIPQTLVLSYLKSAKVFIFTDHEAGFGLAAVEAMAAGLPVVGYDIGILGNVYRKGYLKVPLSDTNQFASRIIQVLTNDNLQNRLAKDAKVEAAKHDWQIVAMKFEKILDRMNV